MAPVLALIVFAICAAFPGAAHAAATPEPPEPTVATVPPVTANEFLPESRDLTDCVGALEKPGCGSEARGGTMATVVFVLMLVGMSIIFVRIAVGVRRNRQQIDESVDA